MMFDLLKGWGEEKLLITKLDNWLKQVGRHKAKVISQKVKVEPFYFNLKWKHACNERIYNKPKYPYILELVV
jgi:hypothetical protein